MTPYKGGREANGLKVALMGIVNAVIIPMAAEFFSDKVTGPGLEKWQVSFRATLIVNDDAEAHNNVIQVRNACRTIMLELFDDPDVRVWLDKPPGAGELTMLHVDLSSSRDRVGYWWNMIIEIIHRIRALLG